MGGHTARSGSALSGFVFVLPRATMDRQEIEQVYRKRREVRASWQACAEMVGRSVHDVRLACDPNYRPEGMVEARIEAGLRSRDFDAHELMILEALGEVEQSYQAGDRRHRDASVTEVCERLDMGANKVGGALPQLEQRGAVTSRRLPTGRRAWRLSAAGRDLVAANG